MLETIGKNLSSPENAERDKIRLSTAQLRELGRFGERANKLGINLAVCGANGELVLLCQEGKKITDINSIDQIAERKRYTLYAKDCIKANEVICRLGEYNQVLAAILKSDNKVFGAALIDLGDSPYPGKNESLKAIITP